MGRAWCRSGRSACGARRVKRDRHPCRVGVPLALIAKLRKSSRRSSRPSSFDRICQAMHEHALGQRTQFGRSVRSMRKQHDLRAPIQESTRLHHPEGRVRVRPEPRQRSQPVPDAHRALPGRRHTPAADAVLWSGAPRPGDAARSLPGRPLHAAGPPRPAILPGPRSR
jgi:hypothetical protein